MSEWPVKLHIRLGWLLHHHGWGLEVAFAFLPKRELMTRCEDEGRMILAAYALQATLYRPYTAIVDRKPALRWSFYHYSDAGEIAERLAATP